MAAMSAVHLIPGNKYVIHNPDRPATMFREGNAKGLEGLTFIAREDDGRLGFDNGFGATFTIDPYGHKGSAKEFYAPGGEGLPAVARPRDPHTHVCIVPRYKYFYPYSDSTKYAPRTAAYEKGDHIGHVNDTGVVLRYGEKAEAPRTQAEAGTHREEDYSRRGGGGGAMGGAGGGGGGAAAAGGAGGGGKPLTVNLSSLPTGHPNNVELRKERKKRTTRRTRRMNKRTNSRRTNRR